MFNVVDVCLKWHITFCSYKKLAIFTEMLLRRRIFHLPQIFLRCTLPPISCSCCYKLPYLFLIQVQIFIIVLFIPFCQIHLSSKGYKKLLFNVINDFFYLVIVLYKRSISLISGSFFIHSFLIFESGIHL